MDGTGLLLTSLSIFVLFFYLFILILPIVLLVALQVWLCKKNLKLGLILPGISLALSLLLVLSMATFSTLTIGGGNTMVSGGVTYIEPDGQEVPAQEEEYIEVPAQEGVPRGEREKTQFHPRALMAVGVVFLVTNIPTAVFGGIWLHYKGRRDTLEDLKKMRIEDLE